MPTAHLSKNYLENVTRPATGVERHWDTEVKGFLAHVQPKAITLYYQRDIRGKTKRILLGRYPTLTVAAARTAARTFDLEMRSGKAKLLHSEEKLLKDALANYLATTEATAQHMAYVRRALEFRLADWLAFFRGKRIILVHNPNKRLFGARQIRYLFNSDVVRMELVNEENYQKLISGTAVFGAILGGVPGAILGQLIGGRKNDAIVAFEFMDGKKLLAAMRVQHFAMLQKIRLATEFGRQQDRAVSA